MHGSSSDNWQQLLHLLGHYCLQLHTHRMQHMCSSDCHAAAAAAAAASM
jgi:hypothetical protein